MALLRRLLNMLRPRALDQQLDDELQFHREMALQKELRRGLLLDEAKHQVAKRMGNEAAAKDGMRDARVISWLASSMQDLRHAAVLLRRDLSVSTLVVLILGLGVGGNAAIFTLFKAAFLDSLPYTSPNRLVTVIERFQNLGIDEVSPTIPEFLDIRDRNRVFEHMAFVDHRDFQLTGVDEPVRVFAARATASLFPLLGVQASRGRLFLTEENRPGHTSVVILSHQFWRHRMAANPAVIGSTIRLNGEPHSIVGVLPAGFTFDYPTLGVPEPVDIYVPFVMNDYYTQRSGGYSNTRRVRAIARLRPDVDHQRADADLQTIGASLVREHPALYRTAKGQPSGFSIRVQPLQEAVAGKHRRLLLLMLASVAIVLVIACGNVAQLLLARSLRRGREVAIRAALGATRWRLLRQFMMESLVLAICEGLLGLLLAGWMTRLLVFLLPVQTPVFETAQLDIRVLGFTFAVSLLAALMFGIVPAVKGTELTAGGRLTSRSMAGYGSRWRHIMIAAEAALAVVLLFAAGLLCQNFWTVLTAPRGFDSNDVAVMQLRLPHIREQALNPSPMMAYREYLEKVAALPGVDSAAIVTGLPVRGRMQARFSIEGAPDDPEAQARQIAMWQRISPDYFRVLRIPIRAGRTFRDDDVAGRPGVIIVNQEFVRRFLPGMEPLGQRIVIGTPLTIVGVVGDVRIAGLEPLPEPQVYVSYLQAYDPNIHLMVRSSLPPGALIARVKQAIRSAYVDQAVFNPTTMERIVSQSVAEPRFQTYLIGAFALLAVIMTASGLYSVVSYLMTQRTSEIAIRVALGASRASVSALMVRQTMVWIVAGIATGAVLGLAARRLVQKLSWSAEAGDPLVFVVALLAFLGVILLACWLPVRRATRLDPATALRCE